MKSRLWGALGHLIHQRSGVLTEDLALRESSIGLGLLPKKMQPEKVTGLVCGYCSTGCSLDVHIRGTEAINITPTMRYPVNLGGACPKGWEALSPLSSSDRATKCLIKNANGQFQAIDWQSALIRFVERFQGLQQKYGPESVAFLSTGQIPTEEMALLGAVAKFGMGFVHGDANTRQCMATSVVAYKEAFGFDAPPFTYKDFEESDVIVFVGANPCIAHPIMWERVGMNRHTPKIIVIDPRKTETAMAATHHYAIEPKSDLTFFYGIAHLLIVNDWIDNAYIQEHTEHFEAFKDHVRYFTPKRVSKTSGISEERLLELASLIHKGARVSFWWSMGVNQSYEGVRVAQALIDLALMTGNMGRPGTGANSITGQCNAMGSRLFSNTTNLLGGRSFLKVEDRQHVANVLNIDAATIPTKDSLAYDQIIEGIVQHKIKGLWIIATNPVHSWINKSEFADVLKNLEFLVVQDMYANTETAQMADLFLPAAGWGEKEGTFINSERRIGRIRRIARSPGEALADFYIFKLVADYWGCAPMFEQWNSPEEVFQILKKLSAGTPCDFTGIRDYKMLDEMGGIQWPCADAAQAAVQERRLFEDGKYFHKDGRARFVFEAVRSKPEAPDEQFPFELITGRGSSSQWHTQTRTGKSAVLRKMYPRHVYVEMNPEDARAMQIEHNQWVYISSRRGQVRAQAALIPTVKLGQLFMAMHYEETNSLTFPAFDPYSRQPSYKSCAVKVQRTPYE